MKQLSPFAAFIFLEHIAFGQTSLVNFKEGTWKNKQAGCTNKFQPILNDLVLMHEILVDTNAVCRYIQIAPAYNCAKACYAVVAS